MRKSDKIKNIKKVNMLTEQRQNARRGLITEEATNVKYLDDSYVKRVLNDPEAKHIYNTGDRESKAYVFKNDLGQYKMVAYSGGQIWNITISEEEFNNVTNNQEPNEKIR